MLLYCYSRISASILDCLFFLVGRKDVWSCERFLIYIYFIAYSFILARFIVWDKNMVHTQFKWCWYHVPTFTPYKVEGMFYPLILAHGGANQSVKTAAIVLQSLTPNAQSVFKILAEHQLSHPDEEGKFSSFSLDMF